MLRPFDLRDLALVHRLRQVGISFHAESELTDTRHSLRGALASMFVGGQFPTYIWKSEAGDERAAFVQLQLKKRFTHAPLIYLGAESPVSGIDESLWLSLFDQLAVQAGNLGLHGLVAEVDETGPELLILRQAGFAVYTRQDIWVLTENPVDFKLTPPIAGIPQLRRWDSVDEWAVHLLYANTVPRLIQMVEPVQILQDGEGWVWFEEGEVAAFLHLYKGPAANWMRVYIHPQVQIQTDALLDAVLATQTYSAKHPVYFCLRRYQSWMQNHLERRGFVQWGSQAVMVKHIVQKVKETAVERAASLDPATIQTTSSSSSLKWQEKGKK